VVGSRPPADHKVWEQWRKEYIFAVRVLSPVTGKDGSHEEAVDEVLHAAILRDVLNFYNDPTPRTIVILTGDGNANGGHNTSFPGVIEQTLRAGFFVEVWSWRQCTSDVYLKFRYYET